MAHTHTDVGRVYRAFRNDAKAETLWKRAAVLDPKNVVCRAELAALYGEFGRHLDEAAVLAREAVALQPSPSLYALLSLTLVRMVPVAISFIGSKVRPVTSLFVGWFGPRGVASILYIYTVMDTEGLRGKELIYAVTMITVLFSVFAHGVTAAPLANWYGRFMAMLSRLTIHRCISGMSITILKSPKMILLKKNPTNFSARMTLMMKISFLGAAE